MLVRIVAGVLALAALGGPSVADDKKEKDKPTVWERESSGVNLTFEFTKETLNGTVLAGENGFVARCKITTDQDGLVKAKVDAT